LTELRTFILLDISVIETWIKRQHI